MFFRDGKELFSNELSPGVCRGVRSVCKSSQCSSENLSLVFGWQGEKKLTGLLVVGESVVER